MENDPDDDLANIFGTSENKNRYNKTLRTLFSTEIEEIEVKLPALSVYIHHHDQVEIHLFQVVLLLLFAHQMHQPSFIPRNGPQRV